MAFVTIAPPAGVFRNGTIYQAKGRWYGANLIRFQEGAIQPIGGWSVRSSSASPFASAVRTVFAWRDNSSSRWIGAGGCSNISVQDEAGNNHDITPSGFLPGRPDAAQNLHYGGGTFGTGAFGHDAPNSVAYLPATVVSLAAWGEDLAICADTDGRIYLWTLDTSTPAAVVANAPANCQGIVVADAGFLFALGADGDGRRVAWCDQQDITLWAADATNQAGDYDLTTVGTLQCGKAVAAGALLFTDVDVWSAQYIGAPLVYGFQRVGSGCGVISKGAVSARDSIAVWMGKGGFWLFDGQGVQALSCDVADAVFLNLNVDQASKVTAVHLSDQGEVWWFYPSAASSENDSYVVWAYRESQRLGANVWTLGALSRTAGTGQGVYSTPLMVDAAGCLWEHETGFNYGGLQPYVETGPFEIGQGDAMAEVQRIVPDELGDGNLTATFYGRMWPDGAETAYGPYTLASPTDVLLQAREIRVRFTGATAAHWAVGTMRLDVIEGDPI
jgi:hypothetical protein